MNSVPAPKEDDERDEEGHRMPSDIIRDITQVRLPNPMNGGIRA